MHSVKFYIDRFFLYVLVYKCIFLILFVVCHLACLENVICKGKENLVIEQSREGYNGFSMQTELCYVLPWLFQ